MYLLKIKVANHIIALKIPSCPVRKNTNRDKDNTTPLIPLNKGGIKGGCNHNAELSNGVKMHQCFATAAGFAEPIRKAYQLFLSDGKPELIVDIKFSDKLVSSKEARLRFTNGIIRIKDDYLESRLDMKNKRGLITINPRNLLYSLGLFLRNVYTLLVVLKDKGIALHATGILDNNKVYIFVGPSKAGKTTVAKLSKDKTVLSDDLILIKKYRNKFMVFPTPPWEDFQGDKKKNKPYQIKAIFKLIQDKNVFLEPFHKSSAVADSFTVPHIPVENIPQKILLERFTELLSEVPYYGLHFRPEPSFWPVILEQEHR